MPAWSPSTTVGKGDADTPDVAEVLRVGDTLLTRWPAARPFVTVGAVLTIIGGFVAAVARPTGFELGSWMAAYLVLIGGVAQIALGTGQAWMAEGVPPRSVVRAELAAWNLGVGVTILGSIAAAPIATTIGAAASVVALSLFLRGVGLGVAGPRWPRLLYSGLILIVLVSTPVGLALSWTRHG